MKRPWCSPRTDTEQVVTLSTYSSYTAAIVKSCSSESRKEPALSLVHETEPLIILLTYLRCSRLDWAAVNKKDKVRNTTPLNAQPFHFSTIKCILSILVANV